jgi:hypothetical protein
MANPRDILALQRCLERAKAQLIAGQLREEDVWRLLQRTGRMLDRDKGSTYRPTLRVIYTLTEALWSNTRQQQALRKMKSQLH